MPKVFVTGLGFISSIGNDGPTVLESLQEMRHGFTPLPEFDKPDIPVTLAGTIKDFHTRSTDPEDWQYPSRYTFRREVLRSMSPHVLYSHCATIQALEDAGLTPEDISNEYTGMYTASAGSPYFLYDQIDKMHKRGIMRCSPMGIVSSISGTVTFNLCASFKIRGHSGGFVSACASTGHALGYALDDIRLGRQKRMIIVGAEDGNLESILPFAGMRALSLEKNPLRASCPFDVSRKGFVGTGGAAVLILESEDLVNERLARGPVKLYAELAGWGQASDGHNVAISHPEGDGLRRAMTMAMQDAKVIPGDVDYVNAHAPSTQIGDLSEVKALHSVFTLNQHTPAISSTKSLTGHGLSMASALEAGICCLSMDEGILPGSAHIQTLDPACEGLNILRRTEKRSAKVVISNSSGFGGANVCLVFRKAVG